MYDVCCTRVPAAYIALSHIYIEMIINYKNNYKIPISDDETIKEAIEWQQTRGARSGRVAWQFILFLAGKYEINI